jgi:hypothetical protein
MRGGGEMLQGQREKEREGGVRIGEGKGRGKGKEKVGGAPEVAWREVWSCHGESGVGH